MDDIYDNHDVFQSDNAWVIKLAQKFIRDPEQFTSCLQDWELKNELTKYTRTLAQDKITSTPYIAIYYDNLLVWKYPAGLLGSMKIMLYLARFPENADQFWSNELFKKIQGWNL
jgi:hypothetical protein